MKYVFFDWGYTLINKFKNVDEEIENILRKYNLSWNFIFRKWKNYQLLISLGKITHEEMFEDFSKITNISKEDTIKIDKLLLESHILDEETKRVIIELYEKGYYLGIITNNSIRNVEYILNKENMQQYFKKIVVSEDVKERKPNLKIYIKAFEDIPKEEYNEIFFISDELLEDLIPVKILGIKTIWYEQNIENKWKKKEQVLIEPDYKIKSISEVLDIIK